MTLKEFWKNRKGFVGRDLRFSQEGYHFRGPISRITIVRHNRYDRYLSIYVTWIAWMKEDTGIWEDYDPDLKVKPALFPTMGVRIEGSLDGVLTLRLRKEITQILPVGQNLCRGDVVIPKPFRRRY